MSLEITREKITYPKVECIIIPGCCNGRMKKGIVYEVAKDSLFTVERELKRIAKEKELKIEDVVKTGSGRLKRRRVQTVYHAMIKRVPNDFVSLDTIANSLRKSLELVIKNKHSKVAICSFGFDELENISLANQMFEICDMYKNKIDIKIMDENREFIKQLEKKNNEKNPKP